MSRDASELLRTVVDLPPFPAVAVRVMGLVNSDRTTAQDLAHVLSADQALTAKLLKLTNSAAAGSGRRVSTVREAVIVLGFKQVRQVAFVTSVINNFKQPGPADAGFDMDAFWFHSVAVGMTAEALARHSSLGNPEEAFTAGILHDVGRVVLRQTMPQEFREAVALHANRGVSLREAEVRTTGYSHDAVGQALGELWRFPEVISSAIGSHHDDEVANGPVSLPSIVARSDSFVLAMESGSGDLVRDAHRAVDAETGGWAAIEARARSLMKTISADSKAA